MSLEASTTVTPEDRLTQQRVRRHETVTGPQGSLALVLTHWVQEPGPIDGVPGEWARAEAPESGLQLTATAADEIIVDGLLVDGTVIVRSQDSMTPSTLRFDDNRTGTVISGPLGFALRVWDAESPALARFDGIDAYPYAPEWVVTGRYEAGSEDIEFGRSRGGSTIDSSPGEIIATIAGAQRNFAVLQSGDALQLVFADATTGTDTYGVGRFLFVRPRQDGTVELDFNRAVVPPCSFSDQFNCPMPPPSNRLDVAVTAGEKLPRWREESAS